MSKEKFAQKLLAELAEKKEWGIDPENGNENAFLFATTDQNRMS